MNNWLAGLMGVGILVGIVAFGFFLRWLYGSFGHDGILALVLAAMIPFFATLGIETWGRK